MTRKKETGTEGRMDGLRLYMEKSMGGAAKIGTREEQRAQDLYYDAMESGDMELIFRALEIDPGNVDCLLQLLAIYDTTDPEGVVSGHLKCTTTGHPKMYHLEA